MVITMKQAISDIQPESMVGPISGHQIHMYDVVAWMSYHMVCMIQTWYHYTCGRMSPLIWCTHHYTLPYICAHAHHSLLHMYSGQCIHIRVDTHAYVHLQHELIRILTNTPTGSTGALVDVVVSMGAMDSTSVYSNTLTLLNTELLVSSGVLSVSGIHSITMKTSVQTGSILLLVVLLGTVFLMVQCCEYVHLYWCMYS